MVYKLKVLLLFVFSISCSASADKKIEPAELVPTEKPKVEPVPEIRPVSEPETPAEIEALDLTGTWRLHRNGNPATPGKTFKLCASGAARFIDGDVESKFESYAVFAEKDPGQLSLFAATGKARHWLFRTVDATTFEVAESEPCPANKSCYSPSFERSVPRRFVRGSLEAICD